MASPHHRHANGAFNYHIKILKCDKQCGILKGFLSTVFPGNTATIQILILMIPLISCLTGNSEPRYLFSHLGEPSIKHFIIPRTLHLPRPTLIDVQLCKATQQIKNLARARNMYVEFSSFYQSVIILEMVALVFPVTVINNIGKIGDYVAVSDDIGTGLFIALVS